MPKNIQEERLRWVLPIVNKELKFKEVAKVCPYGKKFNKIRTTYFLNY